MRRQGWGWGEGQGICVFAGWGQEEGIRSPNGACVSPVFVLTEKGCVPSGGEWVGEKACVPPRGEGEGMRTPRHEQRTRLQVPGAPLHLHAHLLHVLQTPCHHPPGCQHSQHSCNGHTARCITPGRTSQSQHANPWGGVGVGGGRSQAEAQERNGAERLGTGG